MKILLLFICFLHLESISAQIKTDTIKNKSLSEVTISNSKPVSAASSKFLSESDWKNRKPNSAQEMLKVVPGLFIAQHAGGGKAEQIFIRGFDCDHGTDIAIYADGLPVNMPSHGHGQGYADLHFLIPETVKGMDVYKGPSSALFGDFATGASVNFNTMDSLTQNKLLTEISFYPGIKKFNGNRSVLLFQIPSTNKFHSYFAIENVISRGYFDSPQNFTRTNIFYKSVYSIDDNTDLKFIISHFNSGWDASGQIPMRAVNENYISRFGSIDSSEGGTTSRSNASLIFNKKYSRSNFSTQLYAFDYNFKLYSNFTFFRFDSINGDEIVQRDNRHVTGSRSVYTLFHTIGKLQNTFKAGVELRYDRIANGLSNTMNREFLKFISVSNIQLLNTGLFLSETWRFSDRFKIETAVRYDRIYNKLYDELNLNSFSNYQHQLSPKLNITYSPNENIHLFFNSGRGYHSNDARTVALLNNHRLSGSTGAEIGFNINLNKKVFISTALWWMDSESELVFVGDEGTTEANGSSRRVGIDVSGRFNLLAGLSADIDLNVAKNRFTKGIYLAELSVDKFIPLAPLFTSTGGVNMALSRSVMTSLRYRYITDRPANESNTVVAKGYTLLDFNSTLSLKRFQISLTIENVLNSKWNEAQFETESRLQNETEAVKELHFTAGSPQSVKVSLIYSFKQ